MASPSVPLLGNAPFFRVDAPTFVRQNAERLGPVFALDLAGFRIVLIGKDASMLRTYFRLPESKLSSYRALADVGFVDALGHYNVFEAPKLFRQLLRDMSDRVFMARFEASIARSIRRAVLTTDAVDWLPTVRAWFVVAILDALVGDAFLAAHPTFVDEFQEWQDAYEEATAKCFVAPAFARPWIVRPVARGRLALRDALAPHVAERRRATARDDEDVDFLDCLLQARSDETDADVADSLVSLMTAAPKNTSIAFANMMMLVDDVGGADALARLRDPEHAKACLTATLRLTNLVIGSVRVALEPLELTTDAGVTFTLPAGARVGVSHLLRSCPDARDFAALLSDNANDDSLAFSGGVHLCPGARLAYQMAVAAVRAWSATGAHFAADKPRKPPLCFRKVTLAQRRGAWRVRLELNPT